jgi:hypothetical protein
VVPATTGETEALLAALRPGQECWFWLPGTAPRGAFLSLAAMDADGEGTAFGARMAMLYRRFPDSHADAISGVVRRLASGSLVFAAAGPVTGDWPMLKQRLVARYGTAEPALVDADLLVAPGRHG